MEATYLYVYLGISPRRLSAWEWLHFDPSIGTGRPSHASRDVYLYNAGSVHFMLCSPKGGGAPVLR